MGPIKLAQVVITYHCNKDCKYCFVENQRGYVKDMTVEDYTKLLDWFGKNNIKSFNLTGGEPTIHPNIKEFLEIADKKGFTVNIFSNGLFPEKNMEYFNKVNSFLINYNAKSHYTDGEYELLHKNLLNISKKGIRINIMFNITEEISSCKHIVDACRKYNVKEVILDLVIPNSLKSNYFLDKTVFASKKKLLLRFIEEIKKETGLKVRVSRPMPKCLFTKEELFNLKKQQIIYFKCSTGYAIFAVNPDLSTYPCLSIFYNGPKITSFPNIEGYRKFYNHSINTLRWKNLLYEKCKSCIYRSRKDCQGACLCHKTRNFNIEKSENFIIYSQYLLSETKSFTKSVKEAIDKLDKIFGKVGKKIRIYMFDNKEDLLFYSGAYHYPKWVSGFASSNLIYYQYGNREHKRIINELCHLYIQHFSLNKIPTWLNEGFCEYVTFGDNKEKLISLMKVKSILPFEKLYDCGNASLLKYDYNPLDENICYHQSHNFVRYLVNKFSLENVMKLILDKHDDFYEHFKNVFGKEFVEIEREWLELVKH